MRVYNDLLTAVDVGQEAVLILLNYSTAFDTINHEKLFKLLSSKFGINGSALKWFKTYFTKRMQSVISDGHESDSHLSMEGVPQGSVICPLSFTYILRRLRVLLNLMGSARRYMLTTHM